MLHFLAFTIRVPVVYYFTSGSRQILLTSQLVDLHLITPQLVHNKAGLHHSLQQHR